MHRLPVAVVPALLVLAVACSDGGASSSASSSSSSSSSSGGGSSGGSQDAGPACDRVNTCQDEVIAELNLRSVPNTDGITTTADSGVFTSMVNATAGGAFNPTPPSYNYARFTAQGLEKVDLTDAQALESRDWHIAFRRFVVRINSGVSGPGCVTATRLPASATLEDATVDTTGLTANTDDFMTSTCTFISDGSGQASSPATALAGYYSYPGCVKMTYNMYMLDLGAAGRVKFTVDGYYNATAQQQCQDTDSVTTMPTGSGNFTVRWRFVEP